MFMRIALAALIVSAGSAGSAACQPDDAPLRRIADSVERYDRSLALWSAGGGRIYTLPVKGGDFDVWEWEGAVLKGARSDAKGLAQDGVDAFAIGDGTCLLAQARSGFDTLRTVDLVDTATGKVRQTWPVPTGWWVKAMTQAGNGGYAGLVLEELDCTGRAYHLKLGRYDNANQTLKWCCTLSDEPAGMIIRQGLPSDDGKYMAVAAWKNGMALVDVEQGKVLWEKRPRDEVSTNCLAFSGDSKFLFLAGSEGAVYTMDVKTGKILRKSMASLSGKSECFHRAVCLAASPDGRFVAAGTGPKGLVFLFEASTGKLVEVLDHGGSTILVVGFSPDSSALASLAAGKIKVWKMPASQPTTTQKAQKKATGKKKQGS